MSNESPKNIFSSFAIPVQLAIACTIYESPRLFISFVILSKFTLSLTFSTPIAVSPSSVIVPVLSKTIQVMCPATLTLFDYMQ